MTTSFNESFRFSWIILNNTIVNVLHLFIPVDFAILYNSVVFFVCMFFFFFFPYTNADKQIPLNRFLLLPICSSNSLWPWLLLSQSSLAFNSTLIVPEVKDKINKVYDCLVIKDKLSASYTTSSIYCWMISWFFIVPNKTWIQGLCSILLQGKIIKNWWLCRGLKIQSKGNSI